MNVEEKYKAQGYLLLDGSMGAVLIGKQIASKEILGLSFTQPQLIQEIHEGYLAAGSDVILTNSFNVNEMNLRHNGLTATQAAKQSVRLARECARRHTDRFVAYDVGPSGKIAMTKQDMRNPLYYAPLFKEQLESALAEGIDLIIIETMFSLAEAQGALMAAKELCRDLVPVFVSMTFGKTMRTAMGDTLEEALVALKACGANAVGINCTLTPAEMTALIEYAKRLLPSFPLLAQPNRGEPQTMRDGTTTYAMPAEDFARDTLKLYDAGATIIGGCCGADKTCIANIAAGLKRKKAAEKKAAETE